MKSLIRRAYDRLRAHKPFVIVAVLGLALLLTNLGTDYLWADEGDTAVLASSILKFGVPKAWDGVTFTDSDLGARENQQLVMVGTPWVQYYVAAASFLLFGENTFATRLPFALAGWFTVLLGFRLIGRLTGDWRAAFCGALLMLGSVQFLLYAREARYYALSMLFTCWLISIFFRMKSARDSIAFAAVAVLLFHTHPIGAAVLVALAVLTLTYSPLSEQRRWFWLACAPVLVFTVPWFFYARLGYTQMSTPLRGAGELFARIVQYLLETASVTSLIGIIVLFFVLLIQGRRERSQIHASSPGSGGEEATLGSETEATHSPCSSVFLNPQERGFLLLVGASLLCFAVIISLTQEVTSLRIIGLRYTAAVVPLLALSAGMLIAKVSRGKPAVWISLLAVFAVTRLDQIVPWTSWNRSGIFRFGQYIVATHVPSTPLNRFIDTGLLRFGCNLWYGNPGTMGRSCEFLRRNAQPGDVVITNYESEPLYFYTRLPQGLKILANAPVYEAARGQHLPDYVFGVARARWIVWRFAWDGYFGLTWSEVEQALIARGARITEMVKVKETGWENRENVFFYRFCGHKHLFGRHEHHRFRRAHIYRIDYPGSD
jgi:4-amino-4-deoxy-L-arabinose transferase-like glycosyltransferase